MLKLLVLVVATCCCLPSLFATPTSPLHAGQHDTPVTNPASCAAVKPIFIMKNISTEIPDEPVTGSEGLSLCPGATEGGSSCCTSQMEERLRVLVRRDLQAVIRHSALSVQGVLTTNAAAFSDRLVELTHRSENRTQELFAHVYERLAPQARGPIANLHAELRRALSEPATATSLNESSSDMEASVLEEAVNSFFSQLFPLVYRHSVTHASGELAPDYAVCLQATMPEVRPFGETPRALAAAVSRSVRATRVLLRAIKLGVEALETTERVWEREDECSIALLRMSYCARCSGLATVKPCAGYCLNVLRGCLAHLAELDASWNGFVDGVERLILATRAPSALLNAESVIRTLDTRVSEAIMHAMENGPALEKRVKIACGPAQWTDVTTVVMNVTLPSPAQGWAPSEAEDSREVGKMSGLLHGILTSLARSKGFYAGLADTLCSDDSFAETAEDADCWNGHRVAQYTKTVVGPSVGAQKYNPELAWSARNQPDPRVAQLSDRLRHTRQLLFGQLSAALEADSLMLEQGSGSGGGGATDYDDDEDRPGSWGVGSGSGNGPDYQTPYGKETGRKATPVGSDSGTAVKPVSSGHSIMSSVLVWCALTLVLSMHQQQ